MDYVIIPRTAGPSEQGLRHPYITSISCHSGSVQRSNATHTVAHFLPNRVQALIDAVMHPGYDQ